MEQRDQISPDGDRCFLNIRVDSSPERQARANSRRCFPINIQVASEASEANPGAKTEDALVG